MIIQKPFYPVDFQPKEDQQLLLVSFFSRLYGTVCLGSMAFLKPKIARTEEQFNLDYNVQFHLRLRRHSEKHGSNLAEGE